VKAKSLSKTWQNCVELISTRCERSLKQTVATVFLAQTRTYEGLSSPCVPLQLPRALIASTYIYTLRAISIS